MTLGEIEQHALQFSIDQKFLKDRVGKLLVEVNRVRQKHLLGIQYAARQAANSRIALATALEAAPKLFTKPRSLVLHGIKVGFQKGKGRFEWDDTPTVVSRIRTLFPDKAEVLIIIEEKPAKKALEQLPAADLKKLGVRLIESGDEVIIKSADDEIDRFVTSLLAEFTTEKTS